jgi:hypothetical protein
MGDGEMLVVAGVGGVTREGRSGRERRGRGGRTHLENVIVVFLLRVGFGLVGIDVGRLIERDALLDKGVEADVTFVNARFDFRRGERGTVVAGRGKSSERASIGDVRVRFRLEKLRSSVADVVVAVGVFWRGEVETFENGRGGGRGSEHLGDCSVFENGLLPSGRDEVETLLGRRDLWRRDSFDGGVKRTVEPGDVAVLEPEDGEDGKETNK